MWKRLPIPLEVSCYEGSTSQENRYPFKIKRRSKHDIQRLEGSLRSR